MEKMETKGGGIKERQEVKRASTMEEESKTHEHVSDYEGDDESDVEEIVSCVENCSTVVRRAGTKFVKSDKDLRLAFNSSKAGMDSQKAGNINQRIEDLMRNTIYYEKNLEKKKNNRKQVMHYNQKLRLVNKNAEMKQQLHKEFKAKTKGIDQMLDLSKNWIHVDLDMFYVAIELRDNQHLMNKPVCVGSSIVSTSNYVARKYGVRSAMPTHIAHKLCPNLIVIPVHMDKYKKASDLFMAIMEEYDPHLETMGLDEAKIEISDYLEGHNIEETQENIEKIMHEIRDRIFKTLKITASSGYAANSFLAKVCSEKKKPNGQFYLAKDKKLIEKFVENLEIRKFPGVGPQSEDVLKGLGIDNGLALKQRLFDLYILFGDKVKFMDYAYKSYGIYNSNHAEKKEQKSISLAKTIKPTRSIDIVISYMEELSIGLSKKLVREGIMTKNIGISIKLNDLTTHQKNCQIDIYTDDRDVIFKKARELLDKLKLYEAVKLVGVRCSELISKDKVNSGEDNKKKKQGKVVGSNDLLAFFKREEAKNEQSKAMQEEKRMEVETEAEQKVSKCEIEEESEEILDESYESSLEEVKREPIGLTESQIRDELEGLPMIEEVKEHIEASARMDIEKSGEGGPSKNNTHGTIELEKKTKENMQRNNFETEVERNSKQLSKQSFGSDFLQISSKNSVHNSLPNQRSAQLVEVTDDRMNRALKDEKAKDSRQEEIDRFNKGLASLNPIRSKADASTFDQKEEKKPGQQLQGQGTTPATIKLKENNGSTGLSLKSKGGQPKIEDLIKNQAKLSAEPREPKFFECPVCNKSIELKGHDAENKHLDKCLISIPSEDSIECLSVQRGKQPGSTKSTPMINGENNMWSNYKSKKPRASGEEEGDFGVEVLGSKSKKAAFAEPKRQRRELVEEVGSGKRIKKVEEGGGKVGPMDKFLK